MHRACQFLAGLGLLSRTDVLSTVLLTLLSLKIDALVASLMLRVMVTVTVTVTVTVVWCGAFHRLSLIHI